MDSFTAINSLRARFLQICPEKDQVRRIIRPYDTDNHNIYDFKNLDDRVKDFYYDTDGSSMISELNSPPVMTNFLDDYINTARRIRNTTKNTNKYNDYDETLKQNHELDGNISMFKEESMLANQQDTVKANNPLHQFETVPYDSDDSDSEIQRKDKTKNKRVTTTLPFTRIFKGNNTKNNVQNNNKKSSNLNHSKYAMNFDYDEDLDEDLEDEDEEDDNDEDNQLKSKFFKLDTRPITHDNSTITLNNKRNKIVGKSYSLENISLLDKRRTNTSDMDDNKKLGQTHNTIHNTSPSTTNNIINISRLKSQIPILETARNISSSKSENINGTLPNGGTKDDSNKTEDSDLSDIESYINGDDLNINSINLDMEDHHSNKSMILTPLDSKQSNFQNRINTLARDELSEDESQDLSAVSSFGKSLLESEYSSTDFLKNSDSYIPTDRMSLGTDIVHHTVSSHSIPISFEGYGLYNGPNDSTLNNDFDRAVSKMKSNILTAGRDRAASFSSRRNSITHTLTSKRSSLSSNTALKQSSLRNNIRSSSGNINNESTKQPSLLGSSLHKNKNSFKTEYAKSSISQSPTHASRRNLRDTSLHFEKNLNIPTKNSNSNSNSQLSSLFNKKKHKVTNPADALEYFSFVSGTTVPRFEAMGLDVYIQASKKYKRNSFKTKVRKTAKIFDVIGYILYLYTTEFKPDNFENDGFDMNTLIDPNNFSLKIVDEDGDPFEDNFGKLSRTSIMQSISDNEIVLCKVTEEEKIENENETPVPYDVSGNVIEYAKSVSSKNSVTNNEDTTLNQLSFYKPIVGGNVDDLANNVNNSNVLEVTVYKYPNVNPKFNFTTINVLVTANINDILVKYCRMKNMDPNKYALKAIGKNRTFDLNDTVLRLDGNNQVEIIPKMEARRLQLEKIKPNLTKPQLPTIQSNDLTPMTLEPGLQYMNVPNDNGVAQATEVPVHVNKSRKASGKLKLNLTKQNSSGSSSVAGTSGGFFKNKNSSKSSLHTPMQTYHQNHSDILNGDTPDNATTSNFQDLFSGAYHKYKVWRRQQMSLINKHERTLALDGDYVYIVPPEGKMHWHENVKTKSFHISQVILVKKSKRVHEYFKLYVRRGPEDIKRYYFEAVSAQECTEIVTRITNLLNAYKMNHK